MNCYRLTWIGIGSNFFPTRISLDLKNIGLASERGVQGDG